MANNPQNTTAAQPALVDELKKMEAAYEPLLPVEKKLIGYTFAAGVILLIALLVISRAFL